MRLHCRKSDNDSSLTPQLSSESTDQPEGLPPSYDNSLESSTSSLSLNTFQNPQTSGSVFPPPILRQSSSSFLRNIPSPHRHNDKAKEPPKRKNVPYRPSSDQQKYIDRLGSSSSVTALSVTSSNTHTEYFDVLPSFQMFQSILKRDDLQFDENLLVQPPEYGDTRHSSPTPPTLSPVQSSQSIPESSVHNIDQVLDEEGRPIEYDFEENYGFGENESEDGLQTNNTAYYNRRNILGANDTYGHTILDNIDKLQRLNTSPIDIQIFVTKDVPEPNMQNELETRLKEYTNFDMVNGYIIITNTTDHPIPFGLFTVSLEGTIKATEKKANVSDADLRKFSKVLMKKFLKMYDLNASYGYTDVPNSAGIEYEAFTSDRYDNCILGLPNERILQPHTKYKKFFTFKFPAKLLDTTCPSNTLPHILPPPSLGVDRTSFQGKADNIELNKALGYGFISNRGTPLMTKDYGFDDMSVNYTIEAKFIDKINSSPKDPLSHSEINETDNIKDYVVSKSAQYFLRFIPDLKELIKFYNEDILFGNETFGSIGIDGKLFANYLYTTTWRMINSMNTLILEEIDARLDRQELSDQEVKHKNLIVENYNDTHSRQESIVAKEQQVINGSQNEEDFYREQRMIGTKHPVPVFGKKKRKIISSLVKIGYLKMYVRVPDQPIAYSSPKLIMRYNKSESYDLDTNELAPVNSISSNHINELYHRVDEDVSHSVKFSLVFEPLESGTKPPGIASIECNIIAWSFRSDYPLPCNFEYDFFYESLNEIKTTDQVEITKANLQSVKDQADNCINFLKANKTYISKSSYLYLKSIKTLGIKRDTISDFFKPITHSAHPDAFDDNWKGVQQKKSMKWTKDIELPLEVLNKHSINLIPSFQSCLVGRLYCLQVVVKYKEAGGEKNEFADNIVKLDVPILVG